MLTGYSVGCGIHIACDERFTKCVRLFVEVLLVQKGFNDLIFPLRNGSNGTTQIRDGIPNLLVIIVYKKNNLVPFGRYFLN
jgi:hypothetical protein